MDVRSDIFLKPSELVEGRPFTHPDHIGSDVNSLRYMVDQLCLILEETPPPQGPSSPIVIHRPDRQSYIYRLIVACAEQLRSPRQLTFVGFLGQRKKNADLKLADEFDRTLIDEIPEHPGLLSYSTMALISGNYSNLVIFASPDAKQHWSKSKAHGQAVSKLAPHYYRSVRLYNGFLPQGIYNSRTLRLKRIKYFDYRQEPGWQAVREFPEGWQDGPQ